MITAQNDLDFITASLEDPSLKPHLRPVFASALETMGHEQREITETLDSFFAARTLQ